MTSQTLKHAIGIFSNCWNAGHALTELETLGFPMEKISVISKTSDTTDGIAHPGVQNASMTKADAATVGAMVGSIGVGSLTLIVGLGSLVIPGVGPVLALESLITAFLGSGVAATVGGLYGALQGWLVPNEYARRCNDRLHQGDYLVVIEAIDTEIWMAESVLKHWELRTWRVYDAPV
jgi:hypothetical protein